MERDATTELTERVNAAAAARTPLELRGSGSKAFYGGPIRGAPLSLQEHAGIVDYDPQELVLTARAGTPLAHIEARLAECGQHLPFEPPAFRPGRNSGRHDCLWIVGACARKRRAGARLRARRTRARRAPDRCSTSADG